MIEIPDGLTAEQIREFVVNSQAERDAAFDTAFEKEFGHGVQAIRGETTSSRRITTNPPEKYGFVNQRPVNIDRIMAEFAQALNDTDTHSISGTWNNDYGIKAQNDVNRFISSMNTYFNQHRLHFRARQQTIDQREESHMCWRITVVREEPPVMRG